MKRSIVIAGLFFASALSAQATPPRALASDSEILAIIKKRVDEMRSSGIVVGILEANGKTRVVAYGDPGPGQPPLDGNSVFEIGSITKVFTGTMLAQMVLEGKVSLDDPAQKYLPSSVKLPQRNGIKITLGNLSSQNSGLPRMPNNFDPGDRTNPYADYRVEQMYQFLSGYTLPRDPGAQFEYSNLGVGLLGHTLSLATGKTYELLVTQRILAPLGMSSSGISMTPSMKQHLAFGHDMDGNLAHNWDIPTMAGAGALRSTTNDMLKFVSAAANAQTGPLGKALAMAQQPRAEAGMGRRIGLNWITRYTATDTIVWHNGGTGGYRTFIGVEPTRHIGVVVLTNSGGGIGGDDIGFHILDPTVPLQNPGAIPKPRTAITVAPTVLAKYVGRYELAPGTVFVITLKGDALYERLGDQREFRIWPESETDFFLKEVDAQLTFVLDAKGNATSVVLHQNGENAPAPRIK